MKLAIATCQFPITADINRNSRFILAQMAKAAGKKAQIAHFAESALSGYAGVHYPDSLQVDYELLRMQLLKICRAANEHSIWVILGSNHQLSGQNKPHNSLYLINNKGKIVDRYDKMFCTLGDLKQYSAGNHFVTFSVNRIKCGLLICHDFRYQELYRQYLKQDVKVMFHSYHNGNCSKEQLKKANNIWGTIVPPTMQTYAANNYMWISSNNTSSRENSFFRF